MPAAYRAIPRRLGLASRTQPAPVEYLPPHKAQGFAQREALVQLVAAIRLYAPDHLISYHDATTRCVERGRSIDVVIVHLVYILGLLAVFGFLVVVALRGTREL